MSFPVRPPASPPAGTSTETRGTGARLTLTFAWLVALALGAWHLSHGRYQITGDGVCWHAYPLAAYRPVP